MDDFEIVHEIGSGAYGNVYSVQLRGRVFALKISALDDNDCLNSGIVREWIFAKSFTPSPNVCPILNKWSDRRNSYFLMPLYDCNLYEFAKKTRLSHADFHTIASFVQEGILNMHKQGWLHRDLKPENVYVNRDGELVIGDFNLVRYQDPETFLPDSLKSGVATTHVCTLWSRAPELVWAHIQGKQAIPTGPEIDAFSFGILLLSLARGDYVFGKHIEGAGNAKEVRYMNGILTVLGVDEEIRELYELGPEQMFSDFDEGFVNLLQFLPASWSSGERKEVARLIASLLDPLPKRRRSIQSCVFTKTTFNAEACIAIAKSKTERKVGRHGPGLYEEEKIPASTQQLGVIWNSSLTKDIPNVIAMQALLSCKRIPIYRAHSITGLFNMIHMIHRCKNFCESGVSISDRSFLDSVTIHSPLWRLSQEVESEPFLCSLLAAWISTRSDVPATKSELESSATSKEIIFTEGIEIFFTKKNTRTMLESWRRLG